MTWTRREFLQLLGSSLVFAATVPDLSPFLSWNRRVNATPRFQVQGALLDDLPYEYGDLLSISIVDYLREMPMNWMALQVWLSQDTLWSDQVNLNSDLDEYRLLTMVAHAFGMKVAWLPVLKPRGDLWRGHVQPRNSDRWFESYANDALIPIAIKAQELGVDMLLLGSELQQLDTGQYSPAWTRIVQSIRSVYSGSLSYGRNWWWNSTEFEDFINAEWYGLLDYIGISAYFELTDKNQPTINELQNAWRSARNSHRNIVQDLENVYSTFNKPILFTEIGYRSVNGANKEPWNLNTIPDSDNLPNLDCQAACYEAMFRTFENCPWWSGVLVYEYPTTDVLSPTIDFRMSVTPLRKPAEAVMRKWFSGGNM